MLVNRGNGSFSAGVDYPIDRHLYADGSGIPVSVATGDLNGDGKPDLVTANFIEDDVSVLINRPGLCAVQHVVYQTLPAAKRAIVRAKCRVGKISRAYHSYAPKGLVISQKPEFGAVLPIGSKVSLVVSRGQKGLDGPGGEPNAERYRVSRPGGQATPGARPRLVALFGHGRSVRTAGSSRPSAQQQDLWSY